MATLAGVLLREIPTELLAGVNSGSYRVFGSIIRSSSTGRIVGHLQETSALSHLIGLGPLNAVSLIGDAIGIVQNEQIKSAIEVMRSLQLTNLALSTVAIGVSVASTAILLRKLSALESKVDALQAELASVTAAIQHLRQDRIEEDFTRLATLIAQLDECWTLSNPETEWRAIARESHFLADSFARRATEFLTPDKVPLVAVPFIDAFGLASATRVTARMACNDLAAAREAAHMSAVELISLGKEIQLGPLALERARSNSDDMGSPAWTAFIDQSELEFQSSVATMRQRETAAAATVLTIEHIQRTDLSGRDWLQAARTEQHSPLLFLPADPD